MLRTPDPAEARSLKNTLDAIGLPWVAALMVAVMSVLIYLGPALYQTWAHSGPTLVTSGTGNGDGFVAGHDFVAFYTASRLALAGNAADVYRREAMEPAQIELVGDPQAGYLAFMYPPTYLLLTAPLSLLPYFPALAVWQFGPLILCLLFLSRIPVPRPALLMAAFAPAVAQTLFAGQNGLVLAVLLGGGISLVDRRPVLAGILLGLATVKPQIALLLAPALLMGRHWTVLLSAVATLLAMMLASAVLFGPEIWLTYAEIPAQAREWLAAGRLPWERMPTIYTAARMAGLGDTAATLLQIAGLVISVVGVAWVWHQNVPLNLKGAALLAAAPLATPFMYDYDLPFMLFALAWMLSGATMTAPGSTRKLLFLAVWLQPVWWWTLITGLTGISLAPLVYAAFFAIPLRQAHSEKGGSGGPTPDGGLDTLPQTSPRSKPSQR